MLSNLLGVIRRALARYVVIVTVTADIVRLRNGFGLSLAINPAHLQTGMTYLVEAVILSVLVTWFAGGDRIALFQLGWVVDVINWPFPREVEVLVYTVAVIGFGAVTHALMWMTGARTIPFGAVSAACCWYGFVQSASIVLALMQAAVLAALGTNTVADTETLAGSGLSLAFQILLGLITIASLVMFVHWLATIYQTGVIRAAVTAWGAAVLLSAMLSAIVGGAVWLFR